jgi:tRNA G18 (ribose-2'-O)-methylase SpoU
MNKKDTRVVLHNIRSAYNVGSIFRTADACGVSHIYISGYTPAPKDKFGRLRKEITKTALGGEFSVSWSKENISKTITSLKKENFKIVALEQDSRAVDYRKIKNKEKMLIIVGNEVSGISKQVLKKVDQIAEIKMTGKKESLNVSVAFGVLLFGLL